MADTPNNDEEARKAVIAAQVASWNAKEFARLEKRRKERLAADGRGRLASSRGSSPGSAETRTAGRQAGTYQGGSTAQGRSSGVEQQFNILLFKPEHMRNLPDPFTEEERSTWERRLAFLWAQMRYNGPETQLHIDARRELEDFSRTLHTRIRNSNQNAYQQDQPSQQIQQMQQARGFNARGPSSFNTRTALQMSPPPPPQPNFRPTYTRMSRKYLSIETLTHFNVDFEIDRDPEYVLVRRWVPEPEQDMLWMHTKKLRQRRDTDIRDEIVALEADKAQLRAEGMGLPPPIPIINREIQSFRSSSESSESIIEREYPNKRRTKLPNGVDINTIEALGIPWERDGDGSIVVLEALGPKYINEIIKLSKEYKDRESTSLSRRSDHPNKFATMRNIPVSERGGGGLRIENSTISRDNVIGQEARQAELLAQYGKKHFTLAFRNLSPEEEEELVDRDDRSKSNESRT